MLLLVIAILSVAAAGLVGFWSGAYESLAWLWVLPATFVGAFLVLVLLSLAVLGLSCVAVDTGKPQEKNSRYYRFLLHLFCDAGLFLTRVRIHTTGLEQLPEDGRFLLVSNHIHDLDPVMLLTKMRKSKLAFISKKENTTKPVVGKMMHKTLCQLLNRENDREAMKTILNCVQIIQEDKASIAVFPEGYTSMDGLLHPFRNGVFKIAQKAKVPIVVCTLQNTNKIVKNALKLKPTDVQLHLLKVLYPQDVQGMTAMEIGNFVHKMMEDDLGDDLVLKEMP